MLVLGSAIRDTVLLAVFLWLPVMNKERAFFGVRVEPGFYRGEGRATLHRYWLTLIGSFVLFEASGFFLLSRFNQPLLSVLTCLGATSAAFAVYFIHARAVHPHAVRSSATRFASPIQARSLTDFTHWWLEAIVVSLAIAAFAIGAYYYPQIPAIMPVHWNAAGNPDRWAQKSLASVFFLPSLGLYMQIFMIVLKNDIAQARMTLPGSHTDQFLQGKQRYLSTNVLLTDWARVSVALLLFIISLLIITTTVRGLGRFTHLVAVSIWVNAAVMIIGIAYSIWRMKRINDELKNVAGESYFQRTADEEHWRHGGLTYYNPDDPALVVEKLVGFGYTLNMAHPAVRSRLLLLSGVPLFVVWALLSL
jgi:uncharacterized membrane protein